MARKITLIWIIFLTAIVWSSQGLAATRTALVIGNADYKSAPLANPKNDAMDMSQALENLGFEVILKINADKKEMKKALRDFKMKLGRSEIGIFYYAGHGMQIGGTNYLIPVKTNIREEWEVESEAIGANRFLAAMKAAGTPLNIVILDACRDNPFKRSFRSSEKGLAQMSAPAGTIISYATAAGSVAEDGRGRNGTYTEALLKNIKRPGLNVRDMFNDAGLQVMEKTQNVQIPWVSTTPIPDYFLAGGTAPVKTLAPSKGSLAVNTTPPGADIYVNNLHKGLSPVTLNGVTPGKYTVRAVKTGYTPKEKTIRVNGGRKEMVTFNMDEKITRARLYITTAPRGANIRILNISQAYHDGIALAPGRYHIEVSQSGYKKKKQWINISGTQGVDLHVSLEKNTAQAPSGKKAGETWTEPTTGMEFVWVEGGCYQMGDTFGDGYNNEKPVHRVCVDGFWMAKYEVTQGQWKAIMSSNPSYFKNGDNYPVEKVSWDDCQIFINKLNNRSGKRFRLPYEAEWEYAARSGGEKVRFGTGKDTIGPNEANFNASVKYKKSYFRSGQYRKKTVPVDSFSPNSLGLYNMSGNVWEWCQDWYGKNYYKNSPLNNPQGPSSGSSRVGRGGSWNSGPLYVRAADRYWGYPDYRHFSLGFRLLLPSGQ